MKRRARELQLMRVQSADGRVLGHVFDLRCRWAPGASTDSKVDEVIFGRTGLLERLGFVERRPEALPWSAVREVGDRALVVDAGKVPRR
ncbi:MAG TPA: hypothetical protein VJ743_22015 [Albitalea sp.]|nr:hypothetical protein [Albitalea sp.]